MYNVSHPTRTVAARFRQEWQTPEQTSIEAVGSAGHHPMLRINGRLVRWTRYSDNCRGILEVVEGPWRPTLYTNDDIAGWLSVPDRHLEAAYRLAAQNEYDRNVTSGLYFGAVGLTVQILTSGDIGLSVVTGLIVGVIATIILSLHTLTTGRIPVDNVLDMAVPAGSELNMEAPATPPTMRS